MSRHLEVTLLSSYMDEEITPAQLRLVEEHLSDCVDCRGKLAGLRAVAAYVRRLDAVAPPPALAAAVERRVRLASLEESSRFRLEDGLKRWLGQPVLAPAFAIILALGAILYLFAYGVSKGPRHTTRLVVAAAPSEQDTDSLGKRNTFRAESEVPASKSDPEPLGAEWSARSEVKEPSVADGVRTPTAREPTPPASAAPITVPPVSPAATAGAGEGRLVDSRQALTAKLEEIEAESAEVADRPARLKAAESTQAAGSEEMSVAERRAVLLRKLSVLKEDVEAEGARIGEAVPARALAGRTFVHEHGIWVEVGLEGEPAAEILDLRLDSVPFAAELSAFRSLERVRLRVGDRVVEIIYPEAAPRD